VPGDISELFFATIPKSLAAFKKPMGHARRQHQECLATLNYFHSQISINRKRYFISQNFSNSSIVIIGFVIIYPFYVAANKGQLMLTLAIITPCLERP
jgi:hypothetical protein